MHEVKLSPQLCPGYRDNANRQRYFERIHAPSTALLVIDMQNHWVDRSGLGYIKRARDLVPNINELAAALRPKGGTVVWVVCSFSSSGRSSWPMLFDNLEEPEEGAQMRAALTAGSTMHALWPGLDVQPQDPVVAKDRFSAFIQGASDLERLLRQRSIDTVLIAGVATNVCCESTARDAMMLDFRTVMIEDANAARTDEDHLAGLTTFLKTFGAVQSAQEVLERIARG